jgi:hypothetical protein
MVSYIQQVPAAKFVGGEGYEEVVTVGMHWMGGALLDPKTVRTKRHWFVRYTAVIIGHFTMAMAH